MHTRASNSELVEPLLEPERTLNRRRHRPNRRVPFDQRKNPSKNPRIDYPPILNINHFRHFLVTLENLYLMDDEPMWAADHLIMSIDLRKLFTDSNKLLKLGTMHLGLWYPKGSGIETIVYADSDHAGDYVDRKSTSGICTFMGCCLTSWFSKKQTALAISTAEAEYVSAGKACQQALWIKQALVDYGIRLDDIPIMWN
ncbi:hypothetical protein Tco_0990648 [Tanacetum coccineum]|uniref:Copia protein n=1 Tax=Tanacetum coccineum TaxID=301880 RepID=A0ABQ5EXB2_9ASTR